MPGQLSPFYQQLLGIVFGKVTVSAKSVRPLENPACLTRDDLHRLAVMAKVEFSESLRRDRPEEEAALEEPHVFDVFEMEKVYARRNLPLAVCLPVKNQLMWHDAEGNVWSLDSKSHVRKVSSLSGCERVLRALSEDPTPLTMKAMRRESILEPDYEDLYSLRNDDASFRLCNGLNESQQLAVAALNGPRLKEGFFCIQGPPGTGKTTTMVAMINVYKHKNPHKPIIVAAPSNAAVGNIALKLFTTQSHLNYSHYDLVVFGENCDEDVRFLNPLHRGREHRSFRNRYEDAIENKNPKQQEKERRTIAHWLKLDTDASLENLAALCPFYDTEEPSGRRAYREAIRDAQVIFCTLNATGSTTLQKAVPHADTLLLDEAGQCSEADFYVATSFPGLSRIVVVGDPKQLPATVLDQTCKGAGYAESWIGRVQRFFPEKVHLLNTQYRMDPAILEYPNQNFYGNRILSGDNVSIRLPAVEHPFRFIDTYGCGTETKDGTSFINVYEAIVIQSILKTDKDIKKIRSSGSARTIIITPYRAQAKLLSDRLSGIKGIGKVDVSTVDSFQGQEGDVVIVSTVRTKRVGFVDSAQRLNVALTRARRVLRIVGEISLFTRLSGPSALRELARHAQRYDSVAFSNVSSVAWQQPNFDEPTLWEPTLTQKFQTLLKSRKKENERNIALQILFAIALPNVKALYSMLPNKLNPSWYMSALKGYGESLWVVWLMNDGKIEAHFLGYRRDCLRFVQTQQVPRVACIVKRDLTDYARGQPEKFSLDGKVNSQTPLVWRLTGRLQSVLHSIPVLPQGSFSLDAKQDDIVRASPPVIIESRSGTGKTNVLFQHAVAHARDNASSQQMKPICFITVSPRLARELQARYEEVLKVESHLPKLMFFSFRDFLADSLATFGISGLDVDNACTFIEYTSNRRSYQKLSMDMTLVENEVGGVILGSLQAAQQKTPLTETQYLQNRRSNVPNNSKYGLAQRQNIYDEYLRYTSWKRENGFFDVGDIVLRILAEPLTIFFDAAYLDEVQDFSYASIHLILSIAGHDSRWVCAGDTAQMISPGCSFKFDGLKQTMLSVHQGIESKLGTVHHLLNNYRTTRDVLLVGNCILNTAKLYFPGAIEFSQPEVATKDLMLKVTLCEWRAGFASKVKFGHNQAFLFATDRLLSTIQEDAKRWLGEHPFILSSLESKGLEFDDIVIAFNMERKAWRPETGQAICLRLLRELYVAVTRAKRRVVIFIRKDDEAMQKFFENLEYDFPFATAEDVLREFDTETTPETWFQQGKNYFGDEQFKIAASCFSASRKFGWSFLAQGMHQKRTGTKIVAVQLFRKAARHFSEAENHQKVLELMKLIRDIPPWNHADTPLFEKAKSSLPSHLRRSDLVQFAIVQEKWSDLRIGDLIDLSTVTFLIPFRGYAFLHDLIDESTADQRDQIKVVFPLAVADWYFSQQQFFAACMLFLKGRDTKAAETCTISAIESFEMAKDEEDLVKLASAWKSANPRKAGDLTCHVGLMIQLFDDPLVAANSNASFYLEQLGPDTIKVATRKAKLEDFHLFHFHKTIFARDVQASLEETFDPLGIVKWYLDKGADRTAVEYTSKQLKSWPDDELAQDILIRLNLRPSGWAREVERRGKDTAEKILQCFLQQGTPGRTAAAVELSDLLLSTKSKVSKYHDMLRTLWNQDTLNQPSYWSDVTENFGKSKTSYMLRLDRNAATLDRTAAKDCFKFFGRDVVLSAVLDGGPFERDIKDILLDFDRHHFKDLRPFEVLQKLFLRNNTRNAIWYAEFRSSKWSKKQLQDLVFERGMMIPILFQELDNRKMIEETVLFCFNKECFDKAISLSELALSTRSLAEKYALGLAEIWCRLDAEHFDRDSLLWVLWILRQTPKEASQVEISKALLSFGPWITRTLICGENSAAVANQTFCSSLSTMQKPNRPSTQKKESKSEHNFPTVGLDNVDFPAGGGDLEQVLQYLSNSHAEQSANPCGPAANGSRSPVFSNDSNDAGAGKSKRMGKKKKKKAVRKKKRY